MNRNVCAAVIVLTILMVLGWAQSSQTIRAQQTDDGSICVLVFDDANRNGFLDLGEGSLKDINVDLMINQNMIIANHITGDPEPFCFAGLSPQQYTVSFSSPLYEATTPSTSTFSLSPGERVLRNFGAAARAPASGDAAPASPALTMQQRLGLSAFGAAIVMTGMTGLGMLIAYLIYRRSLRR
jgi:hypothetical protein